MMRFLRHQISQKAQRELAAFSERLAHLVERSPMSTVEIAERVGMTEAELGDLLSESGSRALLVSDAFRVLDVAKIPLSALFVDERGAEGIDEASLLRHAIKQLDRLTFFQEESVRVLEEENRRLRAENDRVKKLTDANEKLRGEKARLQKLVQQTAQEVEEGYLEMLTTSREALIADDKISLESKERFVQLLVNVMEPKKPKAESGQRKHTH